MLPVDLQSDLKGELSIKTDSREIVYLDITKTEDKTAHITTDQEPKTPTGQL